jgi:hypothetical protein
MGFGVSPLCCQISLPFDEDNALCYNLSREGFNDAQ